LIVDDSNPDHLAVVIDSEQALFIRILLEMALVNPATLEGVAFVVNQRFGVSKKQDDVRYQLGQAAVILRRYIGDPKTDSSKNEKEPAPN
jgi:hypothetical protein